METKRKIKPASLLLQPLKFYKVYWKGSILRFRHPWVSADRKSGVIVNCSLAKLTPSERGVVEEQATTLLQDAPLEQVNYHQTLHVSLARAYFSSFLRVQIETDDVKKIESQLKKGKFKLSVQRAPKGHSRPARSFRGRIRRTD